MARRRDGEKSARRSGRRFAARTGLCFRSFYLYKM
jgi:hypothetical protein